MFSERTNWRLRPNALSLALEEVRTSGRQILDLTISNPTEAGVRPDAETVLAALANPEAMHYDPQPRGLLGARQAGVPLLSRVARGVRSRSRALDSDYQHERSLFVRFSFALQPRRRRFLFLSRAIRCLSFLPILPTLSWSRIHCSTISVGRSTSIRCTRPRPLNREP